MIARALRLLQIATWLVAVVLAFVVVSGRSDAAPLPATANLTVTNWADSSTSGELRSALEQFAHENQITFAQQVPDFGQRGAVRHLYLVAGDPQGPGRVWLREGRLGDFGGSMSTIVHPLSDAGVRSPIGAYVVFGDPSKAEALRSFFTGREMGVELVQIGQIGPVPRPVLLAGAAVALLTFSMVGAHVVAGTRRYAVSRLHGLPQRNLLLTDLRRLGAWWVVAGLGIVSVAALVILLRFGSAGIGLFVIAAVASQLALLVITVVAHALFLSMVSSVEMLRALKGELPGRTLAVTAYGLRLTGVIVAVATIATTFTLAADVVARDRSREAFDRLGDAAAITLGNAYTLEDQAILDTTVGPWLREVDRQGDLIVAAQQSLAAPQWRGVRAMIVNDLFLEQQPVQLADGGVVDRADAAAVTVVVPDAAWNDRDQLIPLLGLDVQVRPDTKLRYAFRRAAPSQRFFTYAPSGAPSTSVNVWDAAATFVTDPVLVLLPSAPGWLSDTSYASIASQGGALCIDPQIVSRAVAAQPDLERFIRGATPVADRAAAALAEQTAELRMSMFTAGIACLVVAMSGGAAALTHTRRLAQQVFVRFLVGWPFAVTYRSILLVELVLLTGLVAWIPLQIGAQRRALEVWQATGAPIPVDLPTMSSAQMAAITVLALVTSCGFLLALTLAHRRVVRWGASEA